MRPLVLAVVLAGCSADFTAPADELRLPIADRPWDDEAPPEGWCGEASIQMAALHFGAWVPQAVANRLGRPKTPDLWEQDVPTALDALALRYEVGPRSGPAKLLAWTVASLRAGRPVILGVKLVPSEHPEWDVDHLVLAVGFSPSGLLLNTNMDEGQVTASWAGLQREGGAAGMSLVNEQARTFGYAIRGFEPATNVRLEVVTKSTEVTLRAHLSGLLQGSRYVLRRDGQPLQAFVADSATPTLELSLPATDLSRLDVVPEPAAR